jgi:O-antigen/teichoic acid export membrane protein
MPLNLVNAVLPPYVAQLHADGQNAQLGRILRGSAGVASIPAIGMALVAVFAGEDLLGLIYGEEYRKAAPVLAVICVGQLIHVLFGSGGLVLTLTGNGNALTVITFMSSLLLIVGGIAAVGFGPVGVAVAAASALVFQKALMWIWIETKLGISTHARFDMSLFRVLRAGPGG